MKKTIDGIHYDTKNATAIGTAGTLGLLSHWEATLYRTPGSKRFFLVGEGGPMTRFAQSAGYNSWIDGEDLIPLIDEQALQWAQRYLALQNIQKTLGGIKK